MPRLGVVRVVIVVVVVALVAVVSVGVKVTGRVLAIRTGAGLAIELRLGRWRLE